GQRVSKPDSEGRGRAGLPIEPERLPGADLKGRRPKDSTQDVAAVSSDSSLKKTPTKARSPEEANLPKASSLIPPQQTPAKKELAIARPSSRPAAVAAGAWLSNRRPMPPTPTP
ncbi:unnamed protein product, partial [Sphacelaria rigidula]